MATQTIIIGEDRTPVTFVFKMLVGEKHPYTMMITPSYKPKDYGIIELLKKGTFDLMLAYSKDRSAGDLYLGHWNDGIVK